MVWQPGDRKTLVLLTLAGLCSAVLIVGITLLNAKAEPLLLKGLSFGLSISAVLALRRRTLRSPVKLVVFTATCIAADLASLYVGLGVYLLVIRMQPNNGNAPGPIPPVAVFAAGFVGALIIIVSAEACFAPRHMIWKFWLRALFGAAAAGIVGMIGWSWGAGLERLPDLGSPFILSAILVWQPAVALCIGLSLPRQTSGTAQTNDAQLNSQSRFCEAENTRSRKIIRVVFLSAVLGFLCWYLWSYAQARLASAQRRHTLEHIAAEAPRADHLPVVPRR